MSECGFKWCNQCQVRRCFIHSQSQDICDNCIIIGTCGNCRSTCKCGKILKNRKSLKQHVGIFKKKNMGTKGDFDFFSFQLQC